MNKVRRIAKQFLTITSITLGFFVLLMYRDLGRTLLYPGINSGIAHADGPISNPGSCAGAPTDGTGGDGGNGCGACGCAGTGDGCNGSDCGAGSDGGCDGCGSDSK